MSINFSNTIPAPPIGGRNISWQTDGGGNVSAYASLAAAKTIVAPVSGAVTIDCSLGNSFWININAAVTSMTLTNPTDGQEVTLVFAQDATGHAVTIAANLSGNPIIETNANAIVAYKWSYNLANTTWYLIGFNDVQGSFSKTAQVANIAQGSWTPMSTVSKGWYRISLYDVVTTAATTSSTLPSFQVSWTDGDTSIVTSYTNIGATNTGNTVGSNESASIVVYAAAVSAINLATTGYVSSGATVMAYTARAVIEYLGS